MPAPLSLFAVSLDQLIKRARYMPRKRKAAQQFCVEVISRKSADQLCLPT